jgi:hypothetical protein
MPKSPTSYVLPVAGVAFVFALILFYHFHHDAPAPLLYSREGLQNVGKTMGPLVAIAAFIERAVEIVIATTRGPSTLELQRALDAAEASVKSIAQKALDDHKLQTQRYSFCVSLVVSLAASSVGVRAVAPLLEPAHGPLPWFDIFDVGLTTLLLSGGSDGIHQAVTTITAFFDKTKGQ